jgi:hypothetical protein
MANVTLEDLVRALDTIVHELDAVKNALDEYAADKPPEYTTGSVTRGIKTGQCPIPPGGGTAS